MDIVITLVVKGISPVAKEFLFLKKGCLQIKLSVPKNRAVKVVYIDIYI